MAEAYQDCTFALPLSKSLEQYSTLQILESIKVVLESMKQLTNLSPKSMNVDCKCECKNIQEITLEIARTLYLLQEGRPQEAQVIISSLQTISPPNDPQTVIPVDISAIEAVRASEQMAQKAETQCTRMIMEAYSSLSRQCGELLSIASSLDAVSKDTLERIQSCAANMDVDPSHLPTPGPRKRLADVIRHHVLSRPVSDLTMIHHQINMSDERLVQEMPVIKENVMLVHDAFVQHADNLVQECHAIEKLEGIEYARYFDQIK